MADPVSALIDPACSWIFYRCAVKLEEDDHIVRHKPLAGTVTERNPPDDDTGSAIEKLIETKLDGRLLQATVPDRIQRISAPSCVLQLRGRAARLGYRINPPRLQKQDGKPLIQISQEIEEIVLGGFQGLKIYGLVWTIRYMLTTTTREMPVVSNPMLLTDGQK